MWAALVCPFQRATRARPWAMSAISISSGEGSSRSSRRPDSIRCQARLATLDVLDASFGLEAGLAKFAAALLVTEAGDQMVVDHAGGLHEGIDDGRADELEAARAELL